MIVTYLDLHLILVLVNVV